MQILYSVSHNFRKQGYKDFGLRNNIICIFKSFFIFIKGLYDLTLRLHIGLTGSQVCRRSV